MKSLISFAAFAVLIFAAPARAEDVEAEAGGKGVFQKFVQYSCPAVTCYKRPVYTVPKSKTLTLTHLSCFSGASNQAVISVTLQNDDSGAFATTIPTSNGGLQYIVNQDVALVVRGKETLSLSSNAYAGHGTTCTISGQLR